MCIILIMALGCINFALFYSVFILRTFESIIEFIADFIFCFGL